MGMNRKGAWLLHAVICKPFSCLRPSSSSIDDKVSNQFCPIIKYHSYKISRRNGNVYERERKNMCLLTCNGISDPTQVGYPLTCMYLDL
jgi:hypothetical protein